MRYAAKVDDNQPSIVSDLRKLGVSVQPLHTVGKGVPDLLCGFRGKNILIEVKDGAKMPSQQKLTKDQKDWHSAWRGQVAVVNSTEQALELLRVETDGWKHIGKVAAGMVKGVVE